MVKIGLTREEAEAAVGGMSYEEFEAQRWAALRAEEEAERVKHGEAPQPVEDDVDWEWQVLAELRAAAKSHGTADRELMLRAVKQNGMALKWASKNFHARTGHLGTSELISCPGWVLDEEGSDTQCVASFPGCYPEAWRGVSRETLGHSVGCVFLPSAEAGLGWHCEDVGHQDEEEQASSSARPAAWHTLQPPAATEKRRCYCATLYGGRGFETLGYLQKVGPKASKEERARKRVIAEATGAFLWDAREENAIRFELDGRRVVARVVDERRAEEDPLHGMTHCLRYLSAAAGRDVTEWVILKPGPPGGLCLLVDRYGREVRYHPYADFTEEFRPEADRVAKARWEAAGKAAAWGCAWFDRWKRNIVEATGKNQTLVVYFNPGQVGQGKVPWDHLANRATDLWDGVGLGPSQKVEVAWLDKKRIRYLEKDVNDFGGVGLQTGSDFCSDKEVVLEAVSSNGLALEVAAKKLRQDKQVVLRAVQQNGRALRWAGEQLCADHEVVKAAVLQCGAALEYASDELRKDRRLWLNEEALKHCIHL